MARACVREAQTAIERRFLTSWLCSPRFCISVEPQNMNVANGHKSFADHRAEFAQERIDLLRNVHNFNANRQVLAQFQKPGRVQMMTRAIAFCTSRYAGAGDAKPLTQLHDGRVKCMAVPLIGAVDIDRHQFGVHFGFHGPILRRTDNQSLGKIMAASKTPATTPTNPATTLPNTLPSANHQLPSRTSLNVSHSNVENVV